MNLTRFVPIFTEFMLADCASAYYGTALRWKNQIITNELSRMNRPNHWLIPGLQNGGGN